MHLDGKRLRSRFLSWTRSEVARISVSDLLAPNDDALAQKDQASTPDPIVLFRHEQRPFFERTPFLEHVAHSRQENEARNDRALFTASDGLSVWVACEESSEPAGPISLRVVTQISHDSFRS